MRYQNRMGWFLISHNISWQQISRQAVCKALDTLSMRPWTCFTVNCSNNVLNSNRCCKHVLFQIQTDLHSAPNQSGKNWKCKQLSWNAKPNDSNRECDRLKQLLQSGVSNCGASLNFSCKLPADRPHANTLTFPTSIRCKVFSFLCCQRLKPSGATIGWTTGKCLMLVGLGSSLEVELDSKSSSG